MRRQVWIGLLRPVAFRTPTLYTYFTNKEGLFIALVQQQTGKHHQLLSVPNALAKPLPPEQVSLNMAALVIDNFSKNRTLLTLMRLMVGESERFPDLAKTFVREVTQPLLARLVAYLETRPRLNLFDPMVAARVFVGLWCIA